MPSLHSFELFIQRVAPVRTPPCRSMGRSEEQVCLQCRCTIGGETAGSHNRLPPTTLLVRTHLSDVGKSKTSHYLRMSSLRPLACLSMLQSGRTKTSIHRDGYPTPAPGRVRRQLVVGQEIKIGRIRIPRDRMDESAHRRVECAVHHPIAGVDANMAPVVRPLCVLDD